MQLCTKLPSVLYWKNGADRQYLETMKCIYNQDLVDRDIYFRGKIVLVREKNDPRGVYCSFEHVSCETKTINKEKIAVYEKERCARIPWIKTILEMVQCEQCGDDVFKIWDEPSRDNRKKTDTVIWCTFTNYMIVLANEKNAFVIRSAYCVLYPNKINELNANYNKFHRK